MKDEHTHPSDAPDWIGELEGPPFRTPMFTEEMKAEVLRARGSSRRKKPAKTRGGERMRRLGLATAGLCAVLVLTAVWPGWDSPAFRKLASIAGLNDFSDWSPRTLFKENGALKLEALPGGDHAAGAPAGAVWILQEPIEELEGKRVRITAVHRDSGTVLEELAETIVSADMAYEGGPDTAYRNVTRIVSRFGLPLAGLWRFDVLIDDKKYGDVVFDVPDGSWNPSPSFEADLLEEETRTEDFRDASPQTVTGVEGRLAILGPSFAAGRPNKYMWLFWGRDEELTGDLVFTAVKQHSTEIIDVFETRIRPTATHGADAMLQASMTLPSPGLWRIMASIDGQLYGSVVVEVDSSLFLKNSDELSR